MRARVRVCCNLEGSRRRGGGGGVLAEVELEENQILWPGGVLYGGGETYDNAFSWRHKKTVVILRRNLLVT